MSPSISKAEIRSSSWKGDPHLLGNLQRNWHSDSYRSTTENMQNRGIHLNPHNGMKVGCLSLLRVNAWHGLPSLRTRRSSHSNNHGNSEPGTVRGSNCGGSSSGILRLGFSLHPQQMDRKPHELGL